jgi:hypothetical protein
MDRGGLVRESASEALADVEPAHLRATIDDRLGAAAMTPGAFALATARALDPDADAGALAERASGVQLIYEGLRLTRGLVHAEPWAERADGATGGAPARPRGGAGDERGTETGDSEAAAPADGLRRADMEILAADVLVARGFSILARTAAAAVAVEVVRAFGRDQTDRRGADAERAADLDRRLETDASESAATVGVAVGGADGPPEELLAYGRTLVPEAGGFPPGSALPDGAADRIAALVDSEGRISAAE